MRTLSLAGILLAFGSFAQVTYRISGTVVANDTNTPMKHVLVSITSTGKAPERASCVTGEDGRFVFTNLPAGKFSLSAQTTSSLPQLFHGNDEYSTAIVTGPGLNSENIRFAFTRTGSISGMIQDEEGDPVRQAQVLLFHQGIFSGRLRTYLQMQQQSNSAGSFHFGQLKPGAYLVAVAARPWYAQPPLTQAPAGGAYDVAYPVTYYGGSTDADSASVITVTEGGSSRADITLRAVPAVHVDITDVPAERENANVQVFAIGPGGSPIAGSHNLINLNNRWEITGLAPGRYIVAQSSIGRKIVDLSASTSLDLRDFPETHISGRVTFEGEGPDRNAFVVLSSGTTHVQAPVSPDGTFQVGGVSPGHYVVQLLGAPSYYIKSISVGGEVSPDGAMTIAAGVDTKVTIIAGNGAATLDGIAMKNGVPFAGAMVLLIPDDLSRTVLIRRDQSDSDGTFTLPDIAPGRYTLVAIDDGSGLAYMEPSAIKPYLDDGQSISLPRAGNKPIQVTVVSRRR